MNNLIMKNTERVMKFNLIAVVCVGIFFLISNLISKFYLVSGLISILCILMCFVVSLKKVKLSTRTLVISVGQLLIIIIASFAKGTLGDLITMMLASTAMCGIYFNKKLVLAQFIVVNVTVITSFILFRDIAFIGTLAISFIYNLLGYNLGAAFIYTLVKWGEGYIEEANLESKKTLNLLNDIKIKEKQTIESGKIQNEIIKKVRSMSTNVKETSDQMNHISRDLHIGVQSQNKTVLDLDSCVLNIRDQITKTTFDTKNISNKMVNSSQKIDVGNLKMKEMLIAMDAINSTSKEIEKVVKIIENIAMQTRILALNATVEASRAGVNGQGFAVVANEVRSLADKSTMNAKNTSELISKTLLAIEKGMGIADIVAGELDKVKIDIAKNSNDIIKIAETEGAQLDAVQSIVEGMQLITQVVEQNQHISTENTQLAMQVASQAEELIQIVDYTETDF